MTSKLQSKPAPKSNTKDTSIDYWDFQVRKTRHGLYESVTKCGIKMVTALTEDACRQITTDIHIPVMLGTFDGYTSVGRSSSAVDL